MRTKEKILETGLTLFSTQSYHNTGIREITKAIDMPTGSFHYHFKNKEDFTLEVLDYFFQKEIIDPFQMVINNTQLNAREKVIECFALRAKSYQQATLESGKLVSCVMGNLAQEIGGENAAVALKLHKMIHENIISKMAILITEGQQTGKIQSKLNGLLLANMIFNAFEGSLIQRKISRSDQPLKDFMASLEYLL